MRRTTLCLPRDAGCRLRTHSPQRTARGRTGAEHGDRRLDGPGAPRHRHLLRCAERTSRHRVGRAGAHPGASHPLRLWRLRGIGAPRLPIGDRGGARLALDGAVRERQRHRCQHAPAASRVGAHDPRDGERLRQRRIARRADLDRRDDGRHAGRRASRDAGAAAAGISRSTTVNRRGSFERRRSGRGTHWRANASPW